MSDIAKAIRAASRLEIELFARELERALPPSRFTCGRPFCQGGATSPATDAIEQAVQEAAQLLLLSEPA